LIKSLKKELMKKLLLVMAAIFIVAVSNAQLPGISFGPKIGVNLDQVTTNLSTINDKMKTGYDLGVFLRLGGKCYFQPELLYSTSGVNFSNIPIGSPSKIDLKSINVPLMFGARLINLKVVNVRILGGPIASFLVNKQVDYNGVASSTKTVSFNNAKWGAQVGAGVDVLMFTLDVRYKIDFNRNVTQQANDFSWDKQAVNVTLGWKLF
jgi:Outer membrane protein beta-barrel domain